MKYFLLFLLILPVVTAQEVYIPKKSIGYANYDENVVIIRMDKNLTFNQYIYVAAHEFAHFQFQELSFKQRNTIRKEYLSLTSFITPYSQTCKDCKPYEEEFAERFAASVSCSIQ